MEIRKISVFIIAVLMIGALITPLVVAVTEDTLIITFDPDGEIDIDVDYASHNFSEVQANDWSNTSDSYFTLYNNGTVAMDTEIRTNATTDEGDMDLNLSTAVPGTDQYAILVRGLDVEQWLNSSYATHGEYDQGINPNDSKQFGLRLKLGTNLSANHTWQTSTIYFRGTQS